MMFRGREIVYSELGLRVMEKMQGELTDCAVVERRPLVEGKSMTMFLAPGVSQSAKVKKTDIDREENNA
jgi:translation initiation factor IF-3